MKIIIMIEGGLVQNVICSEDAEVFVVDYDVDGLDANEISAAFGNDAYVRKLAVEVNPDVIFEEVTE